MSILYKFIKKKPNNLVEFYRCDYCHKANYVGQKCNHNMWVKIPNIKFKLGGSNAKKTKTAP